VDLAMILARLAAKSGTIWVNADGLQLTGNVDLFGLVHRDSIEAGVFHGS
jgi:hypothetical protein